MWHHVMAKPSLTLGFSFGITDTLKHCCPHSSSVGCSKVDASTLRPKVGDTTRVPRAVASESQCLSSLSFPKSPSAPAQTPPTSTTLLLLSEPVVMHPGTCGCGEVPSLSPCRAIPSRSFAAGVWGWGSYASPSSAARASLSSGMCLGRADVEVLGPSHGGQ